MSIFKDKKKTKEDKVPELISVPEPRKINFICKETYDDCIRFLNDASYSGQLGFIASDNIKLAFIFEHPMNPLDHRNQYNNYHHAQYSVIKKVEDIVFKTKEDLETEEMKIISDKINRLKQEIDAKSKELAEIAQKVRG